MVSNRIFTFAAAMVLAWLTAHSAENNSASEKNSSVGVVQSTAKTEINYTPLIHGVVRTRWEGEWEDDSEFAQRFQVRNARISIEGKVLPQLDYYIRFDACDRGKMKILDAWARWKFAGHWRVQAGQFRVPYAVDCFRGPGTYVFANRSFMVKHMLNMREAGAKIGYYGTTLPLTVEAGVFNSEPMADHDVWQTNMNYAAKATWKAGNVEFSASFISSEPDSVRMNYVDGAITWSAGRWLVEGEYQHQHYTHKAHAATDGWNIFASYAIPLRNSAFNSLSFQGRYDGMTAHSTGTRDDDGKLITNNPARQRITVGSTVEVMKKPLRAAIRLNYEKYFYKNGVTASKGENDKVVAELVVKF